MRLRPRPAAAGLRLSRSHGVRAAIAAAVLALPLRAAADPLAGIELGWDGPTSCPEQGVVAAEARRLLPTDGAYEPTHIEMVVRERTGETVAYRLEFRAHSASRDAERELVLSSCEEVRQAAALLVALTLDPEAVAAAEQPTIAEPTPAPAPAPAAAMAAPPPEPTRRAPPPTAPSSRTGATEILGIELAAGALADSASLPDLAFGPLLGVALRVQGLRFALAGFYLPGAERDIATSSDGTVHAKLWAGGLGLCQLWRLPARLELGPCLGAELGHYAAASQGVSHSGDDSTLWAAGSAGLGASVALMGHVALLASFSGIVPFRRSVLALRDSGAAYTVPEFALRAAVGLRWSVAP